MAISKKLEIIYHNGQPDGIRSIRRHLSTMTTYVNLKLPTEMFGSFGATDGVYPAYHMNKLHWISVLLPDAPDDVVQFLVNVSFEATKAKRKRGNK